MDYISIFDPVPWDLVGLAVIQTATLFIILLCGLKLVGRRVFAEMGPQDLLLLLLVAEACDIGLTPDGSGYWGTIASVTTLLLIVGIIERVPFLRKITENEPVIIFRDKELQVDLKKYLLNESELDAAARKYGHSSYKHFKALVLEDDGSLTAVGYPDASLETPQIDEK